MAQKNRRVLPLDNASGSEPRWRDRKRWYWPLGLIVPGLVPLAWLMAQASGTGIFWWSGPILVFVIIPALDAVIGADSENPPDSVLQWLERDPFYRWATYLYLPGQYLSLFFACWLWAGGGWLTLSEVDQLGLMVTAGTLGGIAINAAHELGHKKITTEKWLSKIALAQAGYGHFFIEHNRGHHVKVATPDDPASARMGESLYSFLPRSIAGGVRSAWTIESARHDRMRKTPWSCKNDVLNAWAITIVLYIVLTVCFGATVLPWLVGQAIFGACLLETVNYLEHYGLLRQKLPDGRYERVRASHSWNSNTIVANVFLFHLQRHSDHHAHPVRRYQALRHTEEAPQLPAGYGAMLVLALFPPLWRRTMDPLVIRHYGGDIRRASLSPRHEKRLMARYLP